MVHLKMIGQLNRLLYIKEWDILTSTKIQLRLKGDERE